MPGWNNIIRGATHAGLSIPKYRSGYLPRAAGRGPSVLASYVPDNNGALHYSPDGLRWATIPNTVTGMTGVGQPAFVQGALVMTRIVSVSRYSRDLRQGFAPINEPVPAAGASAVCALNGELILCDNQFGKAYRFLDGNFQSFETLSGNPPTAFGQFLIPAGGQLFKTGGTSHFNTANILSNDGGRTWYDPTTALANCCMSPLQESVIVWTNNANAARMYRYPIKDLDTDTFEDLGNIYDNPTDIASDYRGGLAEYRGTVVVAGANSGFTAIRVATSRDHGYHWTSQTITGTGANGVMHNGRMFVMPVSLAGPNGAIMVSVDGFQWTTVYNITTNQPFVGCVGDPIF